MSLRPSEHDVDEAAQGWLYLLRAGLVEMKRVVFVHVRRLGELQLYGMDVLRWLTILARDVAALEAAIERMTITRRRLRHLQ